jgi:hypothetical protein
VRGGSIKSREKCHKNNSIGTCAFEAINYRNNHESKQKLEETEKGEIHDREILLSKKSQFI